MSKVKIVSKVTKMSAVILEEKILLWQKKLQDFISYVESTPVDEILVTEIFWNKITRVCNKIQNHVEQTKSLKNHALVTKWIQCFIAIVKKDQKLNFKLTNGPIKGVFQDMFNTELHFPPWFIKSFFNFTFEYLFFDDNILSPHFYNMVRNGCDYNTQKTFIEIITANFDNNVIYEHIIQKNILNKELQNLFTNILGDDDEKTIRTFLNKINNDDSPVRIFSFKCDEIKLNELLLVKDTWIDINIPAYTITFSCKRGELFLENISQNSSKDDEYDIITIRISSISYLRYNSKSLDSQGEITMEITEAPIGYWDTTNEFLRNFRVVILNVTQNCERIKQFIYNYFSKKLEDLSENMDRSNFEFILNKKLDSGGSPASTIILSTSLEEQIFPHEHFRKEPRQSLEEPNGSNQYCNQNFHGSNLEESSVVSATESEEHHACTSMFLRTPKPHNSTNISVDESQRTGNESITDDSICSASIPKHKQFYFNSSILNTPKPRSTNISVAATYSSQEIDNESENALSCTKSIARTGLSAVPTSVPETPIISVRTPEVINQFISQFISASQVINLVSPTFDKMSQTDKDISSVKEIKEPNLPTASKPTIGNLVEDRRVSKDDVPLTRRIVSEDDVPLAKRIVNVPNEDDQQSQISLVESNKTQNSKNELNTSRSSAASTTSSKTRKHKRQNDPNYHPGQQCSNSYISTKKCQRNLQNDESEFEDSSFFSDKERTHNDFMYTKTRIVKKPVLFGFDTDIEVKNRKPRSKRNMSLNLDPLQLPPVKRLKTILPVRRPEDAASYSLIAKQTKDRRKTIDVPNKSEKKRRMSNINSVDHLEEQPQSPPFRLSLKNSNQKSPQQVSNQVPENNDLFDKLKFNIPITQNLISRKNIAFFTSSSDDSPNSPTGAVNTGHPMNIIDHEEIFPPPQIVDEDPLAVPSPSKSPKVNEKVVVNKGKGKNRKKNKVVDTEPANETTGIINNEGMILPQRQIVEAVPGPSKSPKEKSSPKVYGGKVEVLHKRKLYKAKDNALTDTEAKPKRVARTKTNGYETEPPALKPTRKRKRNTKKNANDLDENTNHNVPTTSRTIQNSPKRVPVSDQIRPPCQHCGGSEDQAAKGLQKVAQPPKKAPPTTSQVHDPCQHCGVSRDQIATELEEMMERITVLLSSLSHHIT